MSQEKWHPFCSNDIFTISNVFQICEIYSPPGCLHVIPVLSWVSTFAGRGISSDWPGQFQSCMMTSLKDFLCSLDLKSIETTIADIISIQVLDVVQKSQEDILDSYVSQGLLLKLQMPINLRSCTLAKIPSC